jgi:hypothetical protein
MITAPGKALVKENVRFAERIFVEGDAGRR